MKIRKSDRKRQQLIQKAATGRLFMLKRAELRTWLLVSYFAFKKIFL
jgi:hypothetical protein